MWPPNSRETWWQELSRPWDLIVVGGGIVGAGIAREAAQQGLAVLLAEQGDFSSGTSSRSSKFVHGGLRYLQDGGFRLTYQSVTERQRLLREGAGLVTPIRFLLTHYAGGRPSIPTLGAALGLYDVMGRQWTHSLTSPEQLGLLVPGLQQEGLTPSFSYFDAQTDDARLTLRVLSEAVRAGAVALNYVRVTDLLRDGRQVVGVQLEDRELGRRAEAHGRVVVNATGAWADRLRSPDSSPRIRPLRGSHLVFSAERLPLSQALSFYHPADRRAVTFAPWEGVTLVGTTDLDHTASLEEEPRISPAEVSYLMVALDHALPTLGLTVDDILASYAGVRPVVNTGKADPSRESREHLLRYEDGLLTVTGGKLTTYHVMARAALRAVPAARVRARHRVRTTALDPVELEAPCPEPLRARLLGRYGAAAESLLATARPGELEPVPGLQVTWAELRWAAQHEAVLHLDDLLLRRVRLGLLVPDGAESLLPSVRAVCQQSLGWDDARWWAEEARYREIWKRSYSPPKHRETWTSTGTDPVDPRSTSEV
jgi:glycerol-3-phosphate dehydrogenase